MSVQSEIHRIQDSLLRKVGAYVQKQHGDDLVRTRKTQMEVVRGRLEEIEKGTGDLEAVAEDLEQRVAALEP
jgi:hypothetical protein